MADEGRPPVWGLWNDNLGDWFNPGTQRPFWKDQEAARRAIPKALRQYSMGKWEVREYPRDEPETADDQGLTSPPVAPGLRAG